MKSLRKAKVEVYKKMNVSGKKERETGNKNMKRRASADRDHQHIRTIWDGEYRHRGDWKDQGTGGIKGPKRSRN